MNHIIGDHKVGQKTQMAHAKVLCMDSLLAVRVLAAKNHMWYPHHSVRSVRNHKMLFIVHLHRGYVVLLPETAPFTTHIIQMHTTIQKQ